MSDAISHARKRQRFFDEARELTCMYYGLIPMKGQITKEYIERWLSKWGRTPEQMKQELEELDMFWWYPY